jgi:hypothetical protein
VAPTAFLVYLFATIKQTAFVQDAREFCIINLAIQILFAGSFVFAHDTLYPDLKPIRAVGIKIIYVALWLRILWPCQQSATETYHNWPTFGPLGLWHKWRQKPWQLCPATEWQAVAAYVGLALSGLAGYCFWRFKISNVEVFAGICQITALATVAKFAPARAKLWWQAYLASIEAERTAKAAAERAASAAKAEADRAALAAKEEMERAAMLAAREAAEARQIISQQAQRSVHSEADKIAAERAAQAAEDQIVDLHAQLASMAARLAELQAIAAQPNPTARYLDRNAKEFDAGFYLTWQVLQERGKYNGKTKDRAKFGLFEELAPLAMELGVKPKDRKRQNQPNRTLLESCIMAGLVGFGGEE